MMSLHIPSFVLGVLSLPALVTVVVIFYKLLTGSRQDSRLAGGRPHRQGQAGFEQLRFTPRLIGKLNQSLETKEDHARAS